jgi:hypothetical protein
MNRWMNRFIRGKLIKKFMVGWRNEWLFTTPRPKIYTQPLPVFAPSIEKDELGLAKQGDRELRHSICAAVRYGY